MAGTAWLWQDCHMDALLQFQLQLFHRLPERHHGIRAGGPAHLPQGPFCPQGDTDRAWRHLWSPHLLGQGGEFLTCAGQGRCSKVPRMPQRSAHRDVLVPRGMPDSNPQHRYRGEERMVWPHHIQPESPTQGRSAVCVQLTKDLGKAPGPERAEDTALPVSSREKSRGNPARPPFSFFMT